jgi:predicted DNA-binding antitoxin AbrB/MazE fold protein
MTMMAQAIYENGQLHLLESVNLIEGQRVQIAIEPLQEKADLRAALGDLVAHWPDLSDDSDADLEGMTEEIDRAFQGGKPLSEIVIEDRGV